MNLKKVELHGFKSFADKTEIVFESNITGIVGPNGCGKSNFADAVRWALGERRVANLRCKRMSEVIFGGTDHRKSLSYCEVSLYLDNVSRRYPVDYDEVVVTRKLYANGENEYFLNRSAVLYSDILALFRDSGIGKDGYSIIGQGKVEEILSAKPDARRLIFEEAAGIATFRTKKTDAERHLQRARENLQRARDMVAEVGARLGPLEKEAEEAKKVKELRRLLKLTEVSYFLHQSENSHDEQERIRARLERARQEVDNRQKELEALNRESNQCTVELSESDEKANALHNEITALMVATEYTRGEARRYAERLSVLKDNRDAMLAERKELDARADARDALIAAREEEFSAASTLLIDKTASYKNLSDRLSAQIADVEKREKSVEASTELINQSRERMSEVDTHRAELELERKLLLESMGSASDDLTERRKRLDDATERLNALKAEWEKLEAERKSKADERAAADRNWRAASEEWADAELNRRKLEARKNELVTKISMQEDYKRSFKRYPDVVRRLMQDAEQDQNLKRCILGTVGELIKVPRDYQLAIEIALGGAIQNVVTETQEDAAELIEHLKRRSLGRATFLPVNAVRANPLPYECERVLDEEGVYGVASDLVQYASKYEGIVSNLLGRTVVIESKEDGIRLSKKYRHAVRLVTLDGVLFQQSGAMTGGSAPSEGARILSLETEIEDLKKKLQNVEKDAERTQKDLNVLGAERDGFEEALKVLDARLHKLDVDGEALRTRIEALEHEIELHEAETDKLLEAEGENGKRLKELEGLLEAANEERLKRKTERVSADDYLGEMKDALYRARTERDELRERAQAALVEVTALQSKLDALNREISALKGERQAASARGLDLIARLKTNEAEMNDAQKKIEESALKGEGGEKLEALNAEKAALEEHKKALSARILTLSELRETLTQELTACSERKMREEANLERLVSELNNLTVRIHEDYNLDYDTARLFLDGADHTGFKFDPEKASAEASSLRRRIERFGPINELAEDKFAEEKNRYDESVTQMEDVAKAEKELVEFIDDLASKMASKFKTAFDQINLNFQTVFRELFGGGRARLLLEQEEGQGYLEAGVEIEAEPPGKKPQRISLLSGGERALTAIAILFAILKLNPMPFCILDEIEAALDDANAKLFATYLRKFSRDTQFIVVTHRKPTMEQADVLYGVTQQERGISKIVSVRLAEALKTVEKKADA